MYDLKDAIEVGGQTQGINYGSSMITFVKTNNFKSLSPILIRPAGSTLRRRSRTQIPKRVSAHTLRHSFHPPVRINYDILTIQKLLGYASLKMTMGYTHCVPVMTVKELKSLPVFLIAPCCHLLIIWLPGL